MTWPQASGSSKFTGLFQSQTRQPEEPHRVGPQVGDGKMRAIQPQDVVRMCRVLSSCNRPFSLDMGTGDDLRIGSPLVDLHHADLTGLVVGHGQEPSGGIDGTVTRLPTAKIALADDSQAGAHHPEVVVVLS